MDLDEALEGHVVTMKEARRELTRHGVESEDRDGKLWVRDEASMEGELVVTWVRLPLNSRSILEWLGY
jgi:hypothetical protein